MPRPRRRAGRRVAVAVAIGALSLAAASCGIPNDTEPRAIAPEQAPIDLNPTTTTEPTEGRADVELYFVAEGRLVPVQRATSTATLAAAIEGLLAGPAPEEAEAAGVEQLTTRIPAETELRQVITDTTDPAVTVAHINLGCAPDVADPAVCGLLGFSGTDQAIMMGQFVCTATAIEGVDEVSFLHEGQPQPASLADGTNTTSPVRCLDYRDLAPEP